MTTVTDGVHHMVEERGLILITVLLLLSLLMAAGLGAVVSVQNDLRMTANLRTGAGAAYLADAGIEWGKQRFAAATTMPPILSDQVQNLPAGSYSVSFLSSNQSTPLSAAVVLRSVGTVKHATQTITARLVKTYDLADGALVLRGNARGTNFSGDSFSFSGLDHDLITRAPITGSPPRAAITVGAGAALNQVEDALNIVQRANIVGENADRAVALSQQLPEQQITRIASDLCAAPNAVVLPMPNLGKLLVSSETLGTRVAPQLYCITGVPGSDDSVVFTGNTAGAGVLVIRDAELVLAGNFRWEGWVIVSGSDVGFRVADPAHKEIFGALIVAESGNATGSGPAMVDIQGSLRLVFSRGAFSLAAPLVPPATLDAIYPSLPIFLKQDYWRSINP